MLSFIGVRTLIGYILRRMKRVIGIGLSSGDKKLEPTGFPGLNAIRGKYIFGTFHSHIPSTGGSKFIIDLWSFDFLSYGLECDSFFRLSNRSFYSISTCLHCYRQRNLCLSDGIDFRIMSYVFKQSKTIVVDGLRGARKYLKPIYEADLHAGISMYLDCQYYY